MVNNTLKSQIVGDHHSLPRPNQCLHAFYYAWYGNPETDGRYMHWNHHYMPHWKSSITQQHPQGRHNPPDDIGASFYPELGCYSSNDVAVISAHMQQLQEAGVGVVAVSWYPAGLSDDEGPPPDPVIPVLRGVCRGPQAQQWRHCVSDLVQRVGGGDTDRACSGSKPV